MDKRGAGSSHLVQPDKNIFHTFANNVGKITLEIAELATITKDVELKRQYDSWSRELHFVLEDFRDTVDRL